MLPAASFVRRLTIATVLGTALMVTVPPLARAVVAPGPGTFVSDPATGPAGTVIAVRSDTPCVRPPDAVQWTGIVTLQRSGTRLRFVNVGIGDDGHWAGSITVPDDAEGTLTVGANCFDSGVLNADRPSFSYTDRQFVVTPRPGPPEPSAPHEYRFTSSPGQGPAGTTVTVRSQDPCLPFPAARDWKALVILTRNGAPLASRDLPVDSAGRWSGTIDVPAGTPAGPIDVEVGCQASHRGSDEEIGYRPLVFSVTARVERDRVEVDSLPPRPSLGRNRAVPAQPNFTG